jgi:hypothetical protein
MQIDFDNFRKKGVEAYNRLCAELNGRVQSDATISDSRRHGDPLCTGDIRDEMNALRDHMVTLICLEDRRDGIERLNLEVYEFAPEE